MAKWSGNIGFAEPIEQEPGIWDDVITERHYYGDIIRNVVKQQNSGGISDNIDINNDISIVADPYANMNLYRMRYIEYLGAKWEIKNATIQHPRIIITIGGLWNGQ